jgi:hypothetical protein
MVTVTPLQALSMMNNPFVQRESERLAARALAEGGSLEGAIRRVYQLALGRPAAAEELSQMQEHAQKSGLSHVCWALFNSTEFMYAR